MVREQDMMLKASHGMSYQYIGTELHMEVMEMIAGVFNKKRPFSYANRTKNNQALVRELKVGIISKGQTFGDIDASRNRNYLYTFRTLTSEASVYSI